MTEINTKSCQQAYRKSIYKELVILLYKNGKEEVFHKVEIWADLHVIMWFTDGMSKCSWTMSEQLLVVSASSPFKKSSGRGTSTLLPALYVPSVKFSRIWRPPFLLTLLKRWREQVIRITKVAAVYCSLFPCWLEPWSTKAEISSRGYLNLTRT